MTAKIRYESNKRHRPTDGTGLSSRQMRRKLERELKKKEKKK